MGITAGAVEEGEEAEAVGEEEEGEGEGEGEGDEAIMASALFWAAAISASVTPFRFKNSIALSLGLFRMESEVKNSTAP